MLKRPAYGERADLLRDPIANLATLRSREQLKTAFTEGVSVPLQAIQCLQPGAHVVDERVDGKRMILALTAAGCEREQPEVGCVAG